MSDLTKKALGQSLKELLAQKPLDKITVTEITAHCGVNRMTFYYHFKDIYDLMEWLLKEEGEAALGGKVTMATWQEGLANIFESLLENRHLVQNAYRSVNRAHLENYLYVLTDNLFLNAIEEAAKGKVLAPADENFIAAFYKYAFAGILFHWIDGDMKETPDAIINRLSLLVEGDLINVIDRFAESN